MMANKAQETAANDALSDDAVKLSLESKEEVKVTAEQIAQAEKFKDEGNAAFKGFDTAVKSSTLRKCIDLRFSFTFRVPLLDGDRALHQGH